MLTTDLIRVRRKDGTLRPQFLSKAARKRLAEPVSKMLEVVAAGVESPRNDVNIRLDAIEYKPSDRPVIRGLRKLILDRCEFGLQMTTDPVELRAHLWRLAATHRRGLTPGQPFDRAAVIAQTGERLGLSDEQTERQMYADLKENERLESFDPIDVESLLARYDVALAQGVLLRASHVTVILEPQSPGRLRQLFRSARFHGLLHRIEAREDGTYQLDIDGPFSLFRSVQRYGLKLAVFLPSVLRCQGWSLEAQVHWGKDKVPMRMLLDASQKLQPTHKPITAVSPEVAQLEQRFEKLSSDWSVARAEQILTLKGDQSVCIPDLAFTHRQTGQVIYLEAFGFWSRAAVWQRIESINKGLDAPVILAVGKQLRVSEEVLEDGETASLYVYRSSMSAKAIAERLDRLASQ